jgi:hypothetical protein
MCRAPVRRRSGGGPLGVKDSRRHSRPSDTMGGIANAPSIGSGPARLRAKPHTCRGHLSGDPRLNTAHKQMCEIDNLILRGFIIVVTGLFIAL